MADLLGLVAGIEHGVHLVLAVRIVVIGFGVGAWPLEGLCHQLEVALGQAGDGLGFGQFHYGLPVSVTKRPEPGRRGTSKSRDDQGQEIVRQLIINPSSCHRFIKLRACSRLSSFESSYSR